MKLLQLIFLVWILYRIAKWLSDDDSSPTGEQSDIKQKSDFRNVDENFISPTESKQLLKDLDNTGDIAYLSNDVEIHLPFGQYYRHILRLQNIPDINIEIIEIAGRIKHKEYKEFYTPTHVDNDIDAAILYLGDEWKYRSHQN